MAADSGFRLAKHAGGALNSVHLHEGERHAEPVVALSPRGSNFEDGR